MLSVGCLAGGETAASADRFHNVSGMQVTGDDLLSRVGAVHAGLRSLRATGEVHDARVGRRRVVPIQWALVRPDRCRLQYGDDLAVVIGDAWWSYRADTGRFLSHRVFSRTPIETAAELLSDGVPFVLPSLFARGEAALREPTRRGVSDWRVVGAAFVERRPCYVFERRGRSGERDEITRLSIDQETMLLRGWRHATLGASGEERLMLEVVYSEVTANPALLADTFRLLPPRPSGGEGG